MLVFQWSHGWTFKRSPGANWRRTYKFGLDPPKRIFVIVGISATHGFDGELFARIFLANRGLSLFGLKPLQAMAYRPFCFLGSGLLFGYRRVAPGRLIVAIAPCAWAIEGMHSELINFLHLINPVWVHPVRMVVRRFGHLGHPQFAVEHVARSEERRVGKEGRSWWRSEH